tara:strand:- start:4686 stop:6017 length:1332 start_codon:yes stop_codon:yes gene_type:complete
MTNTPVFLALFLSSSTLLKADLWPQFRGPKGDGISEARNVPVEFGETKNLKWKTNLPGRGWSSPIFDGESLWLTTAIEILPDEEERIELLTQAGEEEKKFKQKQVARSMELALLQVHYETGRLLNQFELTHVDKPDPIHKFNSYASPTPVLCGNHVIAHFGTFGTFCLEKATGKEVWKREIKLDHSVGPGSSPFIYRNLVILICDGTDRQFVTALDVRNGNTVWTTKRPEMRAESGDQKKAYNTPLLITDPTGRDQLICMGSQWMISYAPETGEEIWKLDHGSGFSVVPMPVYCSTEDLVFFSTGFGKPVLIAVHTNGDGDITASDKIAWQESKRIPAKPSPLLFGENLYTISDGGITTCFKASDGEIIWNGRIDGNYSASPIYADGSIYVASEEGKVTVFSPGDEYTEIASNQINGSIMASPVPLDGALVIRSDRAIYKFHP